MSVRRILCVVIAGAVLFGALPARAALNASDNAADSAYSSGWTTGTNGGSGFGPWNIGLDSGTGAIIASSSINGVSPPSGNIDVGGVSWGLYSTANNFVTATRPLDGNLTVGQQILCDFDNGSVGASGLIELSLLSGSVSDSRFQWIVDPTGTTDYQIEQKEGNVNVISSTGILAQNDGVHLDFTLTSADTFTLAVTPVGEKTTNFNGTLTGTSGTGINQIQFLVDDAGAPPNADAFINSLAVVPEPSGLAVVGCVGILLGRSRGRSRHPAARNSPESTPLQ